MQAGDARGSLPERPSRLGRLHPSVLVVCFTVVLVTCLTLDPFVPYQALIVAVIEAAWLGLSGLPPRRLGRLALFGLSLFLPFFLFAPLIGGGEEVFELGGVVTVTDAGLRIPGRIAIRGMLCLLAGAGLAASADLTSLAVGLSRIPLVPTLLVVMTVQTLRWSEVLIEESRGIARAIALRSGGGRGGIELVRSLPMVWLPRVIARAERVTAAMEIRGYGGELPERDLPRLGRADLLGLGGAVALSVLLVSVWWM